MVEARTTTRRRRRTGGRDGAERTEGDAHLQGSLFGAESGDGGPDGGPLGAVRAGRCFLDWLVVEEVTQLDVGLWADIAGQAGAVPTARRLQAAARGAGRLRRGAGAPHARVAAAPDLAGGFLHELTENQRSAPRKSFALNQKLRSGPLHRGAHGGEQQGVSLEHFRTQFAQRAGCPSPAARVPRKMQSAKVKKCSQVPQKRMHGPGRREAGKKWPISLHNEAPLALRVLGYGP